MMKKTGIVLTALMTAVVCAGCGDKDKIPKDWYNESISYFEDGINNGWDNVNPDDYKVTETVRSTAYVTGADGKRKSAVSSGPEEYSDSKNKFGYLLKDLDGDGAEELLIGLINDAPQTQFMDICIWHKDFGATHVMTTGNGEYMYLCADGTLIRESDYSGTPEIEGMKYSSENNSFVIVTCTGITSAGKYELTPLN